MNMYIVFALFLVSAVVILCYLDKLKMRIARNLFFVLTAVLILYIPLAIWGNDLAQFSLQHRKDNLVQTTIQLVHHAIDISNLAFTSITAILVAVAMVCAVSAIIVVVQTAKVICTIIKRFKAENSNANKHPAKKTYQPKLVHSTIQFKRILYLRLCRLNS